MDRRVLRLEARNVARAWGGHLLGEPVRAQPIGEKWLLHEDNLITSGYFKGKTLAHLAREYPGELIGKKSGLRFPLLIKLLDCKEWLSVQVHPDDIQAKELVGATELGKTEAWYILDAKADAQIIAGVKDNTNLDNLKQSILNGKVMQHVKYANIAQGDAVFMPARTLHALGPDLLVYEVQQTSDTTYRIYDWDRPLENNRALHLEESAKVISSQAACITKSGNKDIPGTYRRVSCEYFTLDEILCDKEPIELNTDMESFHALTVIKGSLQIVTDSETTLLQTFETALIPACMGAYTLEGSGCRLLVTKI